MAKKMEVVSDENLFDLPHYDFTSGVIPEEIGDDWFSEGADKDEWEQLSRNSGPSPKKRQRMDAGDGDKMSDTPRQSPRLRAATNNKYKSSEQLELERIEAMRKELAKAKKSHEKTYKKAIAQSKPVSMKSSQPPTMPQGFHFHSDQRIKGTAEVVEDTSVTDFAKMLRSNTNTGTSKGGHKNRPTRPKPFNLTSASTSSLHTAGKYISTAEQVMAYKGNFRSGLRSSSKDSLSSGSRRAESPGLTIAKTPTLSTKGRSRSLKHLTRDEEEDMEFEKHKQQQFKAHAVNHKILTQPQLGVKKVQAKEPTTVKEFNLHTTSSHYHKASSDLDEEKREFHAQPVDKKILEGPIGIKPMDRRPMTVPQSPAFQLKNRLRSREKLQPEQIPSPEPPKVSAKPVPHMGVPFRPQLEHKYTVTKPFAVEQHSKEMLQKKEQKIRKVFEDEKKAREFHATILPSDSPDQLPVKKTRPVTASEPFHLTVDERGQKYQKEWKSKQLEEEEEQAKGKAQFQASSNKVVFKAPFVPEKSNRPLTEMSSFTLNTDQRAVKREFFDQQLKAHEAEIEALKRQREERKEHEEKEAVTQLRGELVHKATTIKKYKQINPQPSDKPLTRPQTPTLQTNRLRSTRHHSDDYLS